MIPLGLSPAQQTALDDTLVDSHSMRVTVYLMNMEGDVVGDLTERLLSGQVDVDASAEVTHSCTLSLDDPERTLHFDSDSPSEGAIYLDRMVRVFYSVRVNAQGVNWVDIPIFTGPLVKMDRTDDVVNIEAQGKEALALGSAWRPMTFKKGTKKVDVIEEVMRERAGETKFSLPELRGKLPRDMSVSRQSAPWGVAQNVARSLDRQLFYDGRGTLRLRRTPENPSFVFRSGDGGSVLTAPQISFSTENLKNIVWIKGGTPKGAKNAISYYEAAPRTHPLSPQRLGRNGVPRYLLDVVEQQSIRSMREARQVAQGRLSRSLMESIEVSVDVLPIPYFDPLDTARIVTDEFANSFRLRAFTIPLTVGETMSLGYTKRVTVKGRRNRRR